MIAAALQQLQQDLHDVAPGKNIKIVAVTKTVSADRIAEAYRAGLRVFGENRIQEALPKMEQLRDLDIEWHFIGHLQTNKAKDAVRHFSWIQSIDSEKLLLKIEQEALKLQKKIEALIELNLGEETSKYGLTLDKLDALLQRSGELEFVTLRGLMIIPPYHDDPEETRPYFRKLRGILEKTVTNYPNLTELSMGMSQDYRIAVEEGATMIRPGTLLFGKRDT